MGPLVLWSFAVLPALQSITGEIGLRRLPKLGGGGIKGTSVGLVLMSHAETWCELKTVSIKLRGVLLLLLFFGDYF